MFAEIVSAHFKIREGVAAAWTRVRNWWGFYPLALFVVLRLILFVWAIWIVHWMPVSVQDKISLYHGTTPLVSGWSGLIWGPWQRWDTTWYEKIAAQGYSSGDLSAAFFPLYPLLIKIAAPFLGNNGTAAAVLIATAAALASFLLLYRFTAEEWNPAVARRTVLLLAAFPTAFFFFVGYTESLFLALALGALLAARRHRWALASILGGVAALTRPQGALFLAVLAVEFFLQYRRREVTLPHALWLASTALGGIAFPVYLTLEFHNPRLWFDVQHWWHRAALPWQSIGAALEVAAHTRNLPDFLESIHDPLAAILFLALFVWGAFRLRPTLTAYMAVIILPPLFTFSIYQPLLPLASMWRYVVAAFPGFILLSQIPFLARWSKPLALALFIVQLIAFTRFLEGIFVG